MTFPKEIYITKEDGYFLANESLAEVEEGPAARYALIEEGEVSVTPAFVSKREVQAPPA